MTIFLVRHDQALLARVFAFYFLHKARMNLTSSPICWSLKESLHAGMTVERLAFCPPPFMMLNSTSSESFAIALQFVKSAGFGSSPERWDHLPCRRSHDTRSKAP